MRTEVPTPCRSTGVLIEGVWLNQQYHKLYPPWVRIGLRKYLGLGAEGYPATTLKCSKFDNEELRRT
jgi:hypothetical protein